MVPNDLINCVADVMRPIPVQILEEFAIRGYGNPEGNAQSFAFLLRAAMLMVRYPVHRQ
jgi:hypothetical protein